MATDEEVSTQRDRVAELRAKLDEAKSAGEQKRNELENDITMTNLLAEEARLEAELAQVNQDNKVSSMKSSAAPLVSAEEQMKAAMLHQKAVADEIAAANKKKPAGQKATDEGNEGA